MSGSRNEVLEPINRSNGWLQMASTRIPLLGHSGQATKVAGSRSSESAPRTSYNKQSLRPRTMPFFFASPAAARDCNEKVRVAWRQCDTRDTVTNDHGQAQREVRREAKISIINNLVRRPVSEIKLIRTDTTLDLSQKGREAEEKREKEWKWRDGGPEYIRSVVGLCTFVNSEGPTSDQADVGHRVIELSWRHHRLTVGGRDCFSSAIWRFLPSFHPLFRTTGRQQMQEIPGDRLTVR